MIRCMLIGALVAMFGAAAPVVAQDQPSDEIAELVEAGKGSRLERQLNGGRTARDYGLLAKAYENQGRRERLPEDREAAYVKSAEYYKKWTVALEKSATLQPLEHRAQRVAAHLGYASMVLSGWADQDLRYYEITDGRGGAPESLLTKLRLADEQYAEAWKTLKPLLDERDAREDEYYALGIYDLVQTQRLDIALARSWTNYYLGLLEPEKPTRDQALQRASAGFRELLDSAFAGQMIYQCYLGLGMTLAELGEYDEAARAFGNIPQYDPGADDADSDASIDLRVRVRYELARMYLKTGAYDDAREVLEPLLERDVNNLSDEERRAAFYFNLAPLLEAGSYLTEADEIRREAEGHLSERSLRKQAERTRARGLSKLHHLAQRGKSWPAIVQTYIAASVPEDADPKTLSPAELLYSARALGAAGKQMRAIERLREAAGRDDLDETLAGEVLFDLGVAQYRRSDLRSAAESFERVAREFKEHPKASDAAGHAYQLWAKVATESGKPDDYARLADTLLELLETFPQHPHRREAQWWLPVALQSAGRLDDAVREFGKIPPRSPHWEESQFRRALCARLAVEQKRDKLSADEYRQRALDAVTLLTEYADEALIRAAAGGEATDAGKWAAHAIVNAAELLASQEIGDYARALATIEGFEDKHPDSDLVGRVLGVRIRAYRGAREFERAAAILDEYLSSVPAERAGAVLTLLAAGMQEEVERLIDAGRRDDARELAAEAVTTFEQLLNWCEVDESRRQNLGVVRSGLARVQYLAGNYDAASELATELLKENPRSGNYQRLMAQILTARLSDTPSDAELAQARAAWETLLRDGGLRKRAPQQYWEARYNWLNLKLRAGQAAEVKTGLTQERVWSPALGGPPWKDLLEGLLWRARHAWFAGLAQAADKTALREAVYEARAWRDEAGGGEWKQKIEALRVAAAEHLGIDPEVGAEQDVPD